MHKLEITGETPEALYVNVVNTLAIFLRGPAQATAAPVQTSEVAVSSTSDVAPSEREVEPATAGDGHHFVAPKKRGAGKKADVVKSDTLNDEIPDLAGGKTIEHESGEVKRFAPGYLQSGPPELTLAGDIIPRLMAIQAAHTKRGNDMPSCVKYIQKLYGPFGIANAKNLKPEQFAEFMEASEGYLSGEA